MFELPGFEGIEEVAVSGEVVEGRAKPLCVYSDRHEDIETSA